jgi:hypothetical protein
MKSLLETQIAADRISTREELFQVLDLLIDLRDPDPSDGALIPATMAGLNRERYTDPVDLWSNANQGQEAVLASDMTSLQELLLGKHERSN